MRGGLVVMACAALAAPGTAHAGRTFYGWLYGTEVMPERGVELQTWVSEENKNEDEANRSESIWGIGPLIGITDQLELALPLEVAWERTPGMSPKNGLHNYGVEARYRMVTQDPEEAPPFAPLLRVGLRRLVLERDVLRPEINLVGSYEAGIVHVLADVGFIGELTRGSQHFELRPGAGVSIELRSDLRFGAEVFAQVSLDDESSTWLIAGPNMSWTHGRFWVSASYGIGLLTVKNAPRMQWGIAF